MLTASLEQYPPIFYADEFQSLEISAFPVQHHFHLSKRDTDRKLVDALGKNIALYALLVALTVLSGAAVVGSAALVATEQSAAQQARV